MGAQKTPATMAANRANVEFTLHPYEAPGKASYGEEAADALQVARERVFKTLVAEVDGELTVGIVPVHRSLNLKALAAAVGGKRAALAESATAERATGYVRGGISPLGQRKRLRTVVDSSADDHTTIFVSAGRRGLQMEVSPTDLIRATGAVTTGIATGE
ncbi:Cys-tRNA(Pro) deacylase [Salinactinospora qingdaonensis]|uniref:Cys-tRNA(Pro)/Cys-tRNA(Cys) deacylase n=1 Tax=Salinactinospora qingdaonensis TaxID=702744 RepID=A0ABP7FM75_9ACTN